MLPSSKAFPNSNCRDVNHPRLAQPYLLTPSPTHLSYIQARLTLVIAHVVSMVTKPKPPLLPPQTKRHSRLKTDHVCALDRLDPLRLWPPKRPPEGWIAQPQIGRKLVSTEQTLAKDKEERGKSSLVLFYDFSMQYLWIWPM